MSDKKTKELLSKIVHEENCNIHKTIYWENATSIHAHYEYCDVYKTNNDNIFVVVNGCIVPIDKTYLRKALETDVDTYIKLFGEIEEA